MPSDRLLIYGANGYTGQLIGRLVSQYGLQPIIAGRNAAAIRTLAEQYQLPYLVFDLSDRQQLIHSLQQVQLVLHVAGPFVHTAKPMMEACLQTKTHYLDITGEIAVFELAKQYHADAIQAGIMIMSGVGFDVVPTDCLALFLKNNLPDANRLELAFTTTGRGLSQGTLNTMAEGLGKGGVVRKNGHLIRKPLGHKGQWIDFGNRKLFAMTIPWGDLATAYHTTGIANIETYGGVSPGIWRLLRLQFLFNWLLRTAFIRKLAIKLVSRRTPGPSDEARQSARSLVWGQVWNARSESVAAQMVTLNGYSFTAHASLLIARKVLNGNFKTGYQTPASVYGPNLVLEVPGTTRVLQH